MKSALTSIQERFQNDTQTPHLSHVMLTSLTFLNLMFNMIFPSNFHKVLWERRLAEKDVSKRHTNTSSSTIYANLNDLSELDVYYGFSFSFHIVYKRKRRLSEKCFNIHTNTSSFTFSASLNLSYNMPFFHS